MRLPGDRVLSLLRDGDLELVGLLPRASNYTFAATVSGGDARALVVYKPQAGESPLWDFPDGSLWRREVAAYEVAGALGWDLVPPTVAREGPHGIGSVQLYVDHVEGEHYLSLMPRHAEVFRRVAALDVVINNADRKSGHCLLEKDTGRIFVVDHGVCFHPEPKLRTVIWDFAGEPLPAEVVADLGALDPSVIGGLLEPEEIEAVRARRDALLAGGRFPEPPADRRSFPWPPV